MPQILYGSQPEAEFPLWVAADAAIDPSGKVSDTLFYAAARRAIEGYLSMPAEDGCVRVEEQYESRVDHPARFTLAEAASTAELILVAKVTRREFGFREYAPGQLLEVEPKRVLHGTAPLDRYYVFLPVGTFSAGPHRICKTDSQYPRTPRVGDRLLLMIPFVERGDEPFLDLVEPSSIVVFGADGAVSHPQRFLDDPAAPDTKRNLLQRVRQLVLRSSGSDSPNQAQGTQSPRR